MEGGGKPVVIANSEGSRTTPHQLCELLTKDGERLVGQMARRRRAKTERQYFYSVKRFIVLRELSAEIHKRCLYIQ
jgi:molecular chaperone DnaK